MRRAVAPIGVALAILLTCLGAPNDRLHCYPAALVGISPLFGMAWRHIGWSQVWMIGSAWMVSCGIILAPDFRSAQWLNPMEIGVGLTGYLLLPWILIGSTLLSLRLTQPCPDGIRPVVVAAVWVTWDGVLAWIRFPIPLHWGALLYDWPLGIQIADWTGIWGVTGFALLINATLSVLLHPQIAERHKSQAAGIALVTSLLVLGYGTVQLAHIRQALAESPSFIAAAIQPVAWLEQDRSWTYRLSQYQRLLRLSAEAADQGAQLLIWPEGSVRARLRSTPLESYLLDPITSLLPPEGALLLGSTEPDPTTRHRPPSEWRYHNAALLYDSEANLIDRSGKRWIFPIFESQRHVPVDLDYQPLHTSQFGSMGVLICLESVLPGPSQQLVRQGAESLIVLADDSSFGNSNWVTLHGALAVFRAVETRRSLVFVNNTGRSLIIDPTGEIQRRGTSFEPAVVRGTIVRQNRRSRFSALFNEF